MKGLDPTIETVACGSSTSWLPTYPEWDRIVLEECWNHIDYISAHHYSRNDDDDTASFLSQGVELDAIITQYRGLLDHVRAVKRSFHRVHVSFDEWNVWYREMATRWRLPRGAPPARGDLQPPGRPRVRGVPPRVPSPRRHRQGRLPRADRQRHRPDPDPSRRPPRQSIYWPFRMLRDAVAGDALRVAVRAPEHEDAAPRRRPRRRRRRHLRRRRPATDPCPSSTATPTSPSTCSCGSLIAPCGSPQPPCCTPTPKPERLGLTRHGRTHRPPRDHRRRRHAAVPAAGTRICRCSS